MKFAECERFTEGKEGNTERLVRKHKFVRVRDEDSSLLTPRSMLKRYSFLKT